MQICHGRVIAKKKTLHLTQTQATQNSTNYCTICYENISDSCATMSAMSCLNQRCKMRSHIVCLANLFLEPGQFVPVEGDCPVCRKRLLWGNLVRKGNGCWDSQNDIDGDMEGDVIISDVDDEDL